MAGMKVVGISKFQQEVEAAKSLIGSNKFISKDDAEKLDFLQRNDLEKGEFEVEKEEIVASTRKRLRSCKQRH